MIDRQLSTFYIRGITHISIHSRKSCPPTLDLFTFEHVLPESKPEQRKVNTPRAAHPTFSAEIASAVHSPGCKTDYVSTPLETLSRDNLMRKEFILKET